MSFNETATIFAVALLFSAPWLAAIVLAIKDLSRNPSGFTFLALILVIVGSMPAAIIFLAYRAWRGPSPHEQSINDQSIAVR